MQQSRAGHRLMTSAENNATKAESRARKAVEQRDAAYRSMTSAEGNATAAELKNVRTVFVCMCVFVE